VFSFYSVFISGLLSIVWEEKEWTNVTGTFFCFFFFKPAVIVFLTNVLFDKDDQGR
jgi:hypothetical protein